MGLTRVEIDQPRDRLLRHPIDAVNGWIAKPFGTEISIGYETLDGRTGKFRLSTYRRADLDPSQGVGFTFYVDFVRNEIHKAGTLDLIFRAEGERAADVAVAVTDEAIALANSCRANQAAKLDSLKQILNRDLQQCEGCVAPSALPEGWPISPQLESKIDAVSSHFYGGMIHEFLKRLPSGAIALDAGAGLRKRPVPNVINVEIYDYPSTDVLAIGQSLPFKDNSFAGILSLAVLEHVDDPFQCARELVRVLKPGGKLLLMMPFLQAEHGYPSHYFNATRSGATKLFEQLDVESQTIHRSNHPINTLNQILGVYHSGLDAGVREEFLNMPVREIFSLAERFARDEDPPLTRLSLEKQFEIAWGTTTVFSKRA
ncbi:class I SAM-dependent methyltransferase [Mesorhizobium sp. M0317]|uniref:class I SAM-dependent methyltransferase n=1 Tax=Mesorhizobium sp. M0317 TaxID=2956935 RepID=UPI00333850DC